MNSRPAHENPDPEAAVERTGTDNSDVSTALSNIMLLVLLAAGSYFLFYDGPDSRAARSIKELWNLGHILYFALLVLLLARAKIISKLSAGYQWVTILTLTLLLGLLIETLQHGTNRTTDIADIYRNFVGCLISLSFTPAYNHSFTPLARRAAKALAIMLVIITMLPFMIAASDEQIARLQFPVLSEFSTPFESQRWKGTADAGIIEPEAANHQRLMKITFDADRRTGMQLVYFPADWRGYTSVNLRLYSPYQQPLPVTIRVHDREHETGRHRYSNHDRYQKKFALNPGWNLVSIGLDDISAAVKLRPADLSQVQNLGIFSRPSGEQRYIYLASVYLE